jgi:hypothetical protein
MIPVALVDIPAWRGTPFVYMIAFEGFDYSAATLTMEVRRYRDAAGAPLIALTNAVPSAQGVSVTIDTTGDLPVSTVQLRINETTIEGLSKSTPRGDDVCLVYALDIAGGGHQKMRRQEGAFIVKASANG